MHIHWLRNCIERSGLATWAPPHVFMYIRVQAMPRDSQPQTSTKTHRHDFETTSYHITAVNMQRDQTNVPESDDATLLNDIATAERYLQATAPENLEETQPEGNAPEIPSTATNSPPSHGGHIVNYDAPTTINPSQVLWETMRRAQETDIHAVITEIESRGIDIENFGTGQATGRAGVLEELMMSHFWIFMLHVWGAY